MRGTDVDSLQPAVAHRWCRASDVFVPCVATADRAGTIGRQNGVDGTLSPNPHNRQVTHR